VRAEDKAKSSSENEGNEEEEEDLQSVARKSNISLLSQHTELKKVAQGMSTIPIFKFVSFINILSQQRRKKVP
jgi:hypothetical protein